MNPLDTDHPHNAAMCARVPLEDRLAGPAATRASRGDGCIPDRLKQGPPACRPGLRRKMLAVTTPPDRPGVSWPNSERRQRFEHCLTSFVLRARRVAAHSLAADPHRLLEVAQVTFRLEPDPATGGTVFVQDLPPEEQIESAAARVRPLLLQGEAIFHCSVFNAIGFFLQGDGHAGRREHFERLRFAWRAVDPRGTGLNAYSVQVAPMQDGQPIVEAASSLADNELAFAWLYGDVVHHDPERLAATGVAGVRERYRAAAPLVCRVMIHTIATLRFVELLASHGLLPVPPAALKAEVVVTDPVMRQHAQVFLAASDADMPPLPIPGQAPGAGWTHLLPPAGPAAADRLTDPPPPSPPTSNN